MPIHLSRRGAIAGLGTILAGAAAGYGGRGVASGFAGHVFGPEAPFAFPGLVERARRMAAEPWRAPVVADPERIALIDYDAHWRIRFREDASLFPAGPDAPVQLFHPGRFFPEPVRLSLVAGGKARELEFGEGMFDMPEDSPAHGLPPETGFAGFRVMRPGMRPDWVSFLGASYFRCDGPFGQYGMSARGIAVDTGLARPEEFPRFGHFWVGPAEEPADTLTVWALLDGPSVAGAYRFGLRKGAEGGGQVTAVSARLFPRADIERLGIAPLTSMYWYSERSRAAGRDWRPEIHDSDGLAIWTGAGERIWRALSNPASVRTSSFLDENPRGFGLIQRDRAFENYQDDGVFYDRRPSVWVEPVGRWGRGAVQLVEIPAHDETFDNIVAYWVPERPARAGDALSFDYRLHWAERDPRPGGLATVAATRQGQGGVPGQPIPDDIDKMVVDFEGEALAGLDADSGVEAVIEASGGRVLEPIGVRPVVGTPRWRLSFDFVQEGPEPVDLRAWLRRDGAALTEMWLAQAATGRQG